MESPQKTHGKSGSAEYDIYYNMRRRCLNKSDRNYPLYGGRGIVICDRWLGADGFVNFFADMGERPSVKHSLDRIDNDGPYAPANCRWATKSVQMANRRVSRTITFHGETLCLEDWGRKIGVSPSALFTRLENGWTIEEALSTPPLRPQTFVDFAGETLSLTEWAKRLGVGRRTLATRLRLGWSVERALTMPVKQKERMITFQEETLSISAWERKLGMKKSTLRARLKDGVPLEIALTAPLQKGKQFKI